MTFRFRAARVLDWRLAQASAARHAVLRADESARAAEALFRDAGERHAQALDDCRRAMAASADAGALERHRNWIERRAREMEQCRRLHDERCRARADAVDLMRAAERRVREMERLRERAWRRHLARAARAEAAAIDQLAVQRHVRRVMEREGERER